MLTREKLAADQVVTEFEVRFCNVPTNNRPEPFVKDKEVEGNDIPLPLQIVFDRGNVHFCEEQ